MGKKRKAGKRKSKKKGHIPLELLEHRLKKLTRIVEKRGGDVPE
jgi:hypothetical protein